jgi:hypothetical protein
LVLYRILVFLGFGLDRFHCIYRVLKESGGKTSWFLMMTQTHFTYISVHQYLTFGITMCLSTSLLCLFYWSLSMFPSFMWYLGRINFPLWTCCENYTIILDQVKAIIFTNYWKHVLNFIKYVLYFISKDLIGVQFNNKMCSCHDIAEIWLKLALNTNQSINQSINLLWFNQELYFSSLFSLGSCN